MDNYLNFYDNIYCYTADAHKDKKLKIYTRNYVKFNLIKSRIELINGNILKTLKMHIKKNPIKTKSHIMLMSRNQTSTFFDKFNCMQMLNVIMPVLSLADIESLIKIFISEYRVRDEIYMNYDEIILKTADELLNEYKKTPTTIIQLLKRRIDLKTQYGIYISNELQKYNNDKCISDVIMGFL